MAFPIPTPLLTGLRRGVSWATANTAEGGASDLPQRGVPMRFMIGSLFGSLLLGSLLLAAAIVFNVPLLVAARLARKRLRPLVSRLALATGFALAAAYVLWTMEWFDVWRHGVPPLRYVLSAYLPWVAALAVAGWFAGGLILRQRRPARG